MLFTWWTSLMGKRSAADGRSNESALVGCCRLGGT
jgi:hypothetical protein